MESTIQRSALREGRDGPREIIGTINDLLALANQRLTRVAETSTAGTGAWATIWTSPELPVNSAWRFVADITGIGTSRTASYQLAAVWRRESGAPAQVGVDTFVLSFESHAAMSARTQASGNTIVVQVQDDGGAVTVTWDTEITVKGLK